MSFLDPGSRGYRIWRTGLGLLLAYLVLGFLTSRLSGDPLSGHESPARVTAAAALMGESAVGAPVLWSGVMSVHSGRSHDAEGTLEEVAAAAVESDIDWVVLGDHPRDWIDEPGVWEPRRIDGVHLSSGAELLVAHVGRTLTVGLDSMPRLWESGLVDLGQTADDDGGFVSIVHPRSPRWGESWKEPTVQGSHAFESFDVSEMARKRLASIWAPYHLMSAFAGIVSKRADETMVRFWRERSNTPALAAYDSLRASGPLVMTGGLNHHPKMRTPLGLFPGYAPAFRTVVNHLELDGSPPTDPAESERLLLDRLRSGRLFVSLGWPETVAGFEVEVVRAGSNGSDGSVESSESDESELTAESDLAMGSTGPLQEGDLLRVDLPHEVVQPLVVRVLRDGETFDWVRARAGDRVEWDLSEVGVYRVEVFRGGIDLGPIRLGLTPWLFSNPIELQPRVSIF